MSQESIICDMVDSNAMLTVCSCVHKVTHKVVNGLEWHFWVRGPRDLEKWSRCWIQKFTDLDSQQICYLKIWIRQILLNFWGTALGARKTVHKFSEWSRSWTFDNSCISFDTIFADEELWTLTTSAWEKAPFECHQTPFYAQVQYA